MASPVTGSFDESVVNHSVTYTSERQLNESLKKKSSFDFAEQIRRLEIEGNKLRAATVSTLSNMSGTGTVLWGYFYEIV